MQRLFLLVAVMLLSGCLTAPPKEAARPTLMPRAQSYKDLTHLPAPTVAESQILKILRGLCASLVVGSLLLHMMAWSLMILFLIHFRPCRRVI